MQWTHEHDELRRTAKRIVDEEINPHVDEWERIGQFPAHHVMKLLGNAGLIGISRSSDYGGLDLDYSYEVACSEEMGGIHAYGVSTAIGVQTNMCIPALAKYGSDALRAEWLTPTFAGDLVGCIGVSEVGSGSDVANVKSVARRDGDDYVINGQKMWISTGMQADWMCMLVNTGEENGPHRNKSLIVVPLNSKGITRNKLEKLGLHSSDTAQIFFDDVRVPAGNLIGEEGRGFIYQMEQFQEERLYVVARSLGIMQDALDTTIEYTRDRQAFGKAVIDNQFVAFRIAEMQTEVEALRAMLHIATEKYVAGEDVTTLASMAKYKMGRLAEWIPGECLRFWGGQGFMHENRISRTYRDMKVGAIGGGSNEIMLQIIAKRMKLSGS
ncbi:MAG: acyl-CoA dehydrogenase [Alphaproteobacteria bacterium]|nr:acyl-CoA dehydrogenase [Alphaproteobacteria bacterium]